jgi:hypothetical protein
LAPKEDHLVLRIYYEEYFEGTSENKEKKTELSGTNF